VIFNAIQASALETAEKMINAALRYDPATLRDVADLDGKLLLIKSTLPPLSICIEATQQRIMLHSNWQDSADTTVTGTLPAMLGLAVSAEQHISFAGTSISVTGDLEFLRQINGIFRNLDIDWEAALASIIGDIPAHMLAKTVRSSIRTAQDAGRRATSAATEVAQEELRLTPTANEFSHRTDDIRSLSSAVDRAAARLNKSRLIVEQLIATRGRNNQPSESAS